MPTLQEQIVILGVKLGGLTARFGALDYRLETLNPEEISDRLEKLETNSHRAWTNQYGLISENSTLHARLDALNSTIEHTAKGGLTLAAGLKALETETAEWIDELQAEDIAHTRRLDALADRVAELEAAPELLRVPGGHGTLSDDYDFTAADGPRTPKVFIEEEIPF